MKSDYNKRLFKSNKFRKLFHLSRFYWLKRAIKKYSISYKNIIELGCYDGKLLDLLEEKPKNYEGFDANWEGGLDIAKERNFGGINANFSKAEFPEDINIADMKFQLGICMETFEHIPPNLVCPYLDKLAKLINGYLLITVPNEKGIFFLLKSILKPKGEGGNYKFTIKDIINLTLGRTNNVERNQHKGFDYDHLIYDVKKYFKVISVSGYSSFQYMPKFMSFGVGIVAKTRNK